MLVGNRDRLRMGQPLLHGGGAIEFVTLEDLIWADVPERYEAGSPNVVGAVALGAACDALLEIGMQNVADHERTALRAAVDGPRARGRVSERSGCGPMLRSTESVSRPSTSRDIADPLLAAILSAEYAIGVRHGCFCAHPLITRLLGLTPAEVRRLAQELRAGTPPRPAGRRSGKRRASAPRPRTSTGS